MVYVCYLLGKKKNPSVDRNDSRYLSEIAKERVESSPTPTPVLFNVLLYTFFKFWKQKKQLL
jgi:hypothetical protein